MAAPLRIGLTLPRTGRHARSAGITYDETYRMWVDEMAEKGGLDGRPVELIVHDDESIPGRAAELYERLIRDDEVDLLLGPCHSEMVEGIADLLERERRLLLQGSGSSHELFRKGRRYLFLCWSGCDFDYPRSFLEWASQLPGPHRPTRAALVYTNGRIGSAVALGTRHYVAQLGLQLVHDEPITAAPFDYDTLFAPARAASPDVVLVGLDHTRPDHPAESTVNAFHAAGLDPALLWLSDNPGPATPLMPSRALSCGPPGYRTLPTRALAASPTGSSLPTATFPNTTMRVDMPAARSWSRASRLSFLRQRSAPRLPARQFIPDRDGGAPLPGERPPIGHYAAFAVGRRQSPHRIPGNRQDRRAGSRLRVVGVSTRPQGERSEQRDTVRPRWRA